MRLQGVWPVRLAALGLSISVLAACGGSGSDGSRAAKVADETANALALRWTAPQAVPPKPALSYATSDEIDLVTAGHSDRNVTIAPVRWEGTSDDSGAEIDVRISVRLPEDTGGAIGSTREASNAMRCYRFVIIANRNYDQVEHSDISCPERPDPVVPTPPAPSKLPDDTEKRVTKLLKSAEAETLADDVQAAFRDDNGVFASSDVDAGRLIVAVGIAGENRDCVVGVRERDGKVSFPGFPYEWLQPGELGCDPRLVTSPPQ
jgi:hypothetical protein